MSRRGATARRDASGPGRFGPVGDAFAVDLTWKGRCLVASVSGEIDLATAPTLVTTVESALTRAPEGATRVAVDLSEVRFLDSAGLNALVRLEKALAAREIELSLVSPSERAVRQVFEITQLTESLRVVDSLELALGEPAAPA